MTRQIQEILAHRNRTIGPFSPLFYREPLHIVSAKGVWMRDARGRDYLDAYNNVPTVGHANERVVSALYEQAKTLNVHTRYLNERILEYSDRLLDTFGGGLDRVYYANSGSEANELAIRIARQVTQARGIIVSDHSYHGTTLTIASMTTGLPTGEPLADNVRPVRIPDLATDPRPEAQVVTETLADIDAAIDSLKDQGYGLAALLFDPLFSTEGMPLIPETLMVGIADRVRRAGGLVITDEVQSGFGRVGTHMWGHQSLGVEPDVVTLGKPMGNGHPMAAVITSAAVQDAFGAHNRYFNTFAGNPVSAAVGMAVLEEIDEKALLSRAESMSAVLLAQLSSFRDSYDFLSVVRGSGMFVGLEFAREGTPDPELAMLAVEEMKRRGVLISKTGRFGNVLKIRPPLVFGSDEMPILIEALGGALDTVADSVAAEGRGSARVR